VATARGKALLKDMMKTEEGLQIAPLIDVVFLLMVYFLTCTSMRKTEADVGITLPGTVKLSKSVKTPDETIIEINAEGRISINNRFFGKDNGRDMPDLVELLQKYKSTAERSKTEAMVTIAAADDTLHQRIIDVMNACAAAGVKNVTVGMGGE
jgi:biopolymer transport protein ExbD